MRKGKFMSEELEKKNESLISWKVTRPAGQSTSLDANTITLDSDMVSDGLPITFSLGNKE